MKTYQENDTLYLCLEGRIDTNNAAAVEADCKKVIDANPGLSYILDAENLVYISSAGLRVILRLRKDHPDLQLINASSEVYDILEMTGFTEMLPVQKAYRQLSVEGCTLIGQGSNGLVYRIDPETVVKVYRNPDALPEIQNERELARKAFVSGINTAIPYDVVKIGSSYGSVFELLSAKSLSKLLKAHPENLEEYLHVFVRLLKQIHATEVSPEDFPDEKAVVMGWVDFLKDHLPAATWEKLHALVQAIPEDHHLIHGDYHTRNVMMQNGETILIDMDTLSYGAPVFDFASIFNAFRGFSVLDHSNIDNFLGISWDLAGTFWQRTLEEYFETKDPVILEAQENKAKLLGYTRLLRRSIRRLQDQPEGPALIAFYREQIIELTEKVNTLSF